MSFEPQQKIIVLIKDEWILKPIECPACGYGYATLSEFSEDKIHQRNSISCKMCGFSDYWDTEKRKEQK